MRYTCTAIIQPLLCTCTPLTHMLLCTSTPWSHTLLCTCTPLSYTWLSNCTPLSHTLLCTCTPLSPTLLSNCTPLSPTLLCTCTPLASLSSQCFCLISMHSQPGPQKVSPKVKTLLTVAVQNICKGQETRWPLARCLFKKKKKSATCWHNVVSMVTARSVYYQLCEKTLNTLLVWVSIGSS